MSAAEIERLTDVIVEHTPGDRELAGRIAGAVWEHMEGEIDRYSAEAVGYSAIVERVRSLQPHHWINPNGTCDSGSTLDAGDAWEPVYFGLDLRDALSAPTDDGATGRRGRAAEPLTGRTGGADGAMRGNGDGTSEGEVG